MTFRFAINTLWALALAFALTQIDMNAQTAPRSVPAQVLAVAGRINANVSLAVNGPLVVAVWAASLPAGTTDIYAAVSRDSGATFAAPVRVNSKPGDARVNGEQPLRVAIRTRLHASREIVAVWTSKADAGGTIVSARSVDSGKTFGPTALVAEGPGNRGWENIAVDAAGGVHVVWLD